MTDSAQAAGGAVATSALHPRRSPDQHEDQAFDRHPDLPPPTASVGVIGWLRRNLFATWFDALLTIAGVYLLFTVIPPLFDWFIADAYFAGDTRSACPAEAGAREGACWVYVKVWFDQFIFGQYPAEERWRVIAAFLVFAAAVGPLLAEKVPTKFQGLWFLFTIIGVPVICYYFLTGGIFGMPVVETSLWGGFMLSLVIGITGITVSLPLGIFLALGRRSKLPVVSVLCTIFIEFWRGVPLITILFMASNMFPLFVPEEISPDKLLRALIGVAFFASAYMAEVIRGGLQSIPKGQTEAAQALGLSFWKIQGLIILPQAIRVTVPGIVNTFIGLFKDGTLVVVIGLAELLGMVQRAATNPEWLGFATEGYVFAGLVFWMSCFAMSRYSMRVEARLNKDRVR